jgi:hypothetical protein
MPILDDDQITRKLLLKEWIRYELQKSKLDQTREHSARDSARSPGARDPSGPPGARADPRVWKALLAIIWFLTFFHYHIFEALQFPSDLRFPVFALLQVFAFYLYLSS